jgi:GGDEF domain-containing protein
VTGGSVPDIDDMRLTLLRRPLSAIGTLLSRGPLTVSCSMGFSIFPHDGADASILLQRADMAMYDYKKDGARKLQMGLPDARGAQGRPCHRHADAR